MRIDVSNATFEELDELAGTKEKWPAPLNSAAFYGLAGDIVRTIEPHTEADPAALLVQALVTFGNAAGSKRILSSRS